MHVQLLGLEVDFINTVQFSNHTGYASFTGKVLTDQEMLELFQGLKDNGLHARYTHILTGYAGSVNVLQATCSVIKQVKQANPNAIYRKLCSLLIAQTLTLCCQQCAIPFWATMASCTNHRK